MPSSLALIALWMGVAGGPHCLAMCGAACAGVGASAPGHNGRGLWAFHLGRMTGYALLGGLAAASMQVLGWLSVHAAALRPAWTMLHAGAFGLGLMLAWSARQPVWLDQGARRLWHRVRSGMGRAGAWAPLAMGVVWALMPCGLLYSALMVAAMTSEPWQGAVCMLLFAIGSGVSLWAGPALFSRMSSLGDGRWGMRLAGLALMASSGTALWLGLVHEQAPWCVNPA